MTKTRKAANGAKVSADETLNLMTGNSGFAFVSGTKSTVVLDPQPCPEVTSRLRARTRSICMQRGEVIRLEQNSGVSHVEMQSGAIWLTGTPANGDVLLQNGEQFKLRGEWPYVIEALEAAGLLLVSNL